MDSHGQPQSRHDVVGNSDAGRRACTHLRRWPGCIGNQSDRSLRDLLADVAITWQQPCNSPTAEEMQVPEIQVPAPRLRVAIVGCGDVTHRHYLPPLAALADRAEIVGCGGARRGAAERLAAAFGLAVPEATPLAPAYDSLVYMLRQVRPDALLNL